MDGAAVTGLDGPPGRRAQSAPVADPAEVERIRQAHAVLAERLRAAGGSGVRIVAVTKGFPATTVMAAVEAGLCDFGESYAQEFAGKHDEVDRWLASQDTPPAIRWHMIGRLQTNKVKVFAGRVALWQSVDRAELVSHIARRDPGAEVLVQVSLDDELDRGGCPAAQLEGLVQHASDSGLRVRGLMGVAPQAPAAEVSERFRSLVGWADHLGLHERCIGMSHDLELAVEAGATMVRVGTALFGTRPPKVAAAG